MLCPSNLGLSCCSKRGGGGEVRTRPVRTATYAHVRSCPGACEGERARTHASAFPSPAHAAPSGALSRTAAALGTSRAPLPRHAPQPHQVLFALPVHVDGELLDLRLTVRQPQVLVAVGGQHLPLLPLLVLARRAQGRGKEAASQISGYTPRNNATQSTALDLNRPEQATATRRDPPGVSRGRRGRAHGPGPCRLRDSPQLRRNFASFALQFRDLRGFLEVPAASRVPSGKGRWCTAHQEITATIHEEATATGLIPHLSFVCKGQHQIPPPIWALPELLPPQTIPLTAIEYNQPFRTGT